MAALLKQLALPPAGLILIAAIGMCLIRRFPKAGFCLLAASLILLYLLGTPYVSSRLLSGQEIHPAIGEPEVEGSRATSIVVLTSTYSRKAPEYGGTSVDTLSLERARYAAYLYKSVLSPILVTGGSKPGTPTHSARELARTLEEEFAAPVRWSDAGAENTCGNAKRSAEILHPQQIFTVYLVTHAWHMRRAQEAFSRAGFDVIPAPTAFTANAPISFASFVPSAKAMRQSELALHEVLGRYAYRWICRPSV